MEPLINQTECTYNGCGMHLPSIPELIEDHYITKHRIVNNSVQDWKHHICIRCGHVPLCLFLNETQRDAYWTLHMTHHADTHPDNIDDDHLVVIVGNTPTSSPDIAVPSHLSPESSSPTTPITPRMKQRVLQYALPVEAICIDGFYCRSVTRDHTTKEGGCSRNHYLYEFPFLLPGSIKPPTWCPDERPFEKKACPQRLTCPYDHIRISA